MRGRLPLAEAAEAEALWEPWANAALFRWILATSAVQFLSGGGRLSFTCVERAAAGGHDTAVRVICMRGTVIRVPSWSSTLHSCGRPSQGRHHHFQTSVTFIDWRKQAHKARRCDSHTIEWLNNSSASLLVLLRIQAQTARLHLIYLSPPWSTWVNLGPPWSTWVHLGIITVRDSAV